MPYSIGDDSSADETMWLAPSRPMRFPIHMLGESCLSVFTINGAIPPAWPLESTPRPGYRIHHLGPATAVSAAPGGGGYAGDLVDIIVQTTMPQPTTCLVSLGGVDCGVAAQRAIAAGAPTAEAVAGPAVALIARLDALAALGHVPIAFAPYGFADASYLPDGKDHGGSPASRNDAVRAFNRQVLEACRRRGHGFLTLFPRVVGESQAGSLSWYQDGIHLRPDAVDALERLAFPEARHQPGVEPFQAALTTVERLLDRLAVHVEQSWPAQARQQATAAAFAAAARAAHEAGAADAVDRLHVARTALSTLSARVLFNELAA